VEVDMEEDAVGWAVLVLELVQEEGACVQTVERAFLIKEEFPVIR